MTPQTETGPSTTPARSSGHLRPLSAMNHAGLVLFALLAVVDLGGALLVQEPPPSAGTEVQGPPAEVLWFSFATGVVTLACVALAWAGRRRVAAVRLAAAARILSAITALPAFFVPGVPAAFVAWGAVTVLVTVVAVVLVLVRPRPRR